MHKKLIVVDSGNVMHKAIFAFSANSAIIPTYTYLRMIIGYFKKIGVTLDDKVIIAEDFGSWRKEIDSNYKRQRKALREQRESPEWWQINYDDFNKFIPKLNKCLPWHFCRAYKIESDDWASVAVRFIDAEEKILISADADWQQLCVLPNVKIFSPYTKAYKIIKNPEQILLNKIRGDKVDNLLTVPQTEAEWEKRKMIVDLLSLPLHIEQMIRPVIETLPEKKLYLHKMPYKSCRIELEKMYNLEG